MAQDKIIYETDGMVIRINAAETMIFIHDKLNGREIRPPGYLIGCNCIKLSKTSVSEKSA